MLVSKAFKLTFVCFTHTPSVATLRACKRHWQCLWLCVFAIELNKNTCLLFSQVDTNVCGLPLLTWVQAQKCIFSSKSTWIVMCKFMCFFPVFWIFFPTRKIYLFFRQMDNARGGCHVRQGMGTTLTPSKWPPQCSWAPWLVVQGRSLRGGTQKDQHPLTKIPKKMFLGPWALVPRPLGGVKGGVWGYLVWPMWPAALDIFSIQRVGTQESLPGVVAHFSSSFLSNATLFPTTPFSSLLYFLFLLKILQHLWNHLECGDKKSMPFAMKEQRGDRKRSLLLRSISEILTTVDHPQRRWLFIPYLTFG